MTIAGILLAAGAGTRFGGGKLLHPLPDGTPIGLASARTLAAALERTLAIVRPGDAALVAVLAPAVGQVVECEHAPLGMGHSIACGVAASADADGWVIALADMPRVPAEAIRAAARALVQGAGIVTVHHGGERGHPVGFAARFRGALGALTGDSGGRDILRAHPEAIVRIDCDDPGVLFDIDTREALGRAPHDGT